MELGEFFMERQVLFMERQGVFFKAEK